MVNFETIKYKHCKNLSTVYNSKKFTSERCLKFFLGSTPVFFVYSWLTSIGVALYEISSEITVKAFLLCSLTKKQISFSILYKTVTITKLSKICMIQHRIVIDVSIYLMTHHILSRIIHCSIVNLL